MQPQSKPKARMKRVLAPGRIASVLIDDGADIFSVESSSDHPGLEPIDNLKLFRVLAEPIRIDGHDWNPISENGNWLD